MFNVYLKTIFYIYLVSSSDPSPKYTTSPENSFNEEQNKAEKYSLFAAKTIWNFRFFVKSLFVIASYFVSFNLFTKNIQNNITKLSFSFKIWYFKKSYKNIFFAVEMFYLNSTLNFGIYR